MFDKLGEVEKKYESLCHQLQNPDVANNQTQFRQLMKEQADLEKVVKIYREYKKLKKTIEDNKQMLADEKSERRQLTALLSDQREKDIKPQARGFWARLKGA